MREKVRYSWSGGSGRAILPAKTVMITLPACVVVLAHGSEMGDPRCPLCYVPPAVRHCSSGRIVRVRRGRFVRVQLCWLEQAPQSAEANLILITPRPLRSTAVVQLTLRRCCGQTARRLFQSMSKSLAPNLPAPSPASVSQLLWDLIIRRCSRVGWPRAVAHQRTRYPQYACSARDPFWARAS